MELEDGTIASDVINDYIFVSGGKMKMKRVQSIHLKLLISINGIIVDGSLVQKVPNLYSFSVSNGDDLIQRTVLNGDSARIYYRDSSRSITGRELAELKFQTKIFPELNYEEDTYKVELLGYEIIDGRRTYKIKVTNADDIVKYQFFDAYTGLILRERMDITSPKGETIEQRIDFYNYKEVDGVKYPFEKQILKGEDRIIMKITSIQFNEKVNEMVFKLF